MMHFLGRKQIVYPLPHPWQQVFCCRSTSFNMLRACGESVSFAWPSNLRRPDQLDILVATTTVRNTLAKLPVLVYQFCLK